MKASNLKSIFIVDDDPFFQSMLSQSVFNEMGIRAEVYNNGEACIEQLHKMPEVILLDHDLNSELNGIEVLKAIKSFSKNIDVIFLSGQEELAVAVNSLKYGAFNYVAKNNEGLKNINQQLLKIAQKKKTAITLKQNYVVLSKVITSISILNLLVNYYA